MLPNCGTDGLKSERIRFRASRGPLSPYRAYFGVSLAVTLSTNKYELYNFPFPCPNLKLVIQILTQDNTKLPVKSSRHFL